MGIIYVLELIAMWYLRLQPELPTLCHGPNATARAAQPYSLKGNQARTQIVSCPRADKSLAMVPYVQPAPLERAAWAAKLEYGPVPATCRIISRFRNSQTVKLYFRFFSFVCWLPPWNVRPGPPNWNMDLRRRFVA